MVFAEVQGTPFLDALTVRSGDRIWLRGPNGAGKTTLLRLLAGLPVHVPGRASVDGADARERHETPWCPQDARDALIGLTVAGEARMRRRAPPEGLADRDVTQLSDGEDRRLAIGLMDGALWLLDEPAEGLDDDGIAWLRARIEEAEAVVFTDHSGRLADLATRTVDLGHDAPPQPFASTGRSEAVRLEAEAGANESRGVAWPALNLPAGRHIIHAPNGWGKTTWLEHVAQEACIDGRPARPGRDVRMLMAHGRDHLLGERVADDLARCDAAVRDLLVPASLLARHPMTLSGGEAQRVALAKVLGTDAPAYLLDEPEAHLDDEGRRALQRVLDVRADSVVVVASHDPGWPAADRLEVP